MSYFPIVLSADSRRRTGLAPQRLQNWYAQPLPAEANKPTRARILPTPGRTPRVDLGGPIEGVYCEPGVRSGALFAVAGRRLFHISEGWVATLLGTIAGSADIVFAGLRDALYIASQGKPYRYNGTLTQVTDPDAPDLATMTVLAQRIVGSELDGDTLYWSASLDGTAWEALGFATAEQLPDANRVAVRVSGQLLLLGEKSIEVHQVTGDAALPFANVTAQSIDETEGVISRFAWALKGDKIYLVGGNHRIYVMSGFALKELPTNGELEDALQLMSSFQRQQVTCFAYTRGTHEFLVIRLPGYPAFVLDVSTGFWHTRKTWGREEYIVRYHARAYAQDVVGVEGDSMLYTLNETEFTDAGAPIERIATLKPAFGQNESVGSMCVDLQAFGQPLTGQGSDPRLMVDVATDGRSDRDDTRAETTIQVGKNGKFDKPTLWGLGDMPAGESATITLRLTDPIGLSLCGAWFNEGQM